MSTKLIDLFPPELKAKLIQEIIEEIDRASNTNVTHVGTEIHEYMKKRNKKDEQLMDEIVKNIFK